VAQFEKGNEPNARLSGAKSAPLRAARPDSSLRKIRSLGMTSKLSHYRTKECPDQQAALLVVFWVHEIRLTLQSMNVKHFLHFLGLVLPLATAVAFAQSARVVTPQYSTQGTVASAAAPQAAAVSYASVSQLNGLLAQLEATSKATQADLARLRIERWKTDSSSKKQALSDVDSIQRNLQDALPQMITDLRNSPEDLAATFKLYRNMDALSDVFSGVAESAGAFGPKDDFQALSTDLSNFESTRKQLADRMENLASSKEQEIVRLRTDLKTAQAATPASPPKKVVVDDTEPAKKPAVKKKTTTKKPATAPKTTTPSSTQPAQNQSPQNKPQ
jgi:hypothetical protein